tara:strand:- start:455 stop:571 length:117 start_codon:yes stop_codon:yes gene_type:complete
MLNFKVPAMIFSNKDLKIINYVDFKDLKKLNILIRSKI